MPDRAVTGSTERGRRKLVIGRFQLLQADDVRRPFLQPPEHIGKPPVDAVDVVGRNPHRKLSNCARMCLSLPFRGLRRRKPKPPSPEWQVPVRAISALEDRGVAEIWDDVARFSISDHSAARAVTATPHPCAGCFKCGAD
jgi:hypothetical protein